MEKRYPRDHFTKALIKICERLDTQSQSLIYWKRRVPLKDLTANVSIEALWAVGSYARGALDCGDLDLLVQACATRDGKKCQLPSYRTMAKQFFKSPANVRFYWGTPQENTSGVPFEEAKIIWQDKVIDWHKAINSIIVDPDVGHFYRETDQIPFRMEQVKLYSEEVEELISLRAQGIIKWYFESFTPETISQPETEEELKFVKMIEYFCGKKTQQLLPYLLYLFKNRRSSLFGNWCFHVTQAQLRHGGTHIFIGAPEVPVHLLDKLSTNKLLIAPHLSRRGPNGAWFIQRGDNHPLYTKLKHTDLFYLIDQQGNSLESYYLNKYRGESRVFVLYKDKNLAMTRARIENEELAMSLNVEKIQPEELLRVLAFTDILELDDSEYAMTQAGKLGINHEKILNKEEVLSLLM